MVNSAVTEVNLVKPAVILHSTPIDKKVAPSGWPTSYVDMLIMPGRDLQNVLTEFITWKRLFQMNLFAEVI